MYSLSEKLYQTTAALRYRDPAKVRESDKGAVEAVKRLII